MITLLAALLASSVPAASSVMDADAACRLFQDAGKHLGETVTFRGQYRTDHLEWTDISPINCDAALSVQAIAPDVAKLIASVERPPMSPTKCIEGTYTATFIPGTSRTDWLYESKIQLSVSRVADLTERQNCPRTHD